MITINLYYILLRDNLLYMYKIISIVYVTDVYIYIYIYIYTLLIVYTIYSKLLRVFTSKNRIVYLVTILVHLKHKGHLR